MTASRFSFDRFLLDCADRQLRCDGVPVELNSRYLDALALLVREQGRLVSKDRFLEEVWRGVPVTDEALTQCIKTLRRQLGDSAGAPRFIETVPKHGYRFIAAVEEGDIPEAAAPPSEPSAVAPSRTLVLIGAGTMGGAVAGIVGGLLYGFAGASQGSGAASTLIVLLCLTVIVAVVGAAAVAAGIALADRLAPGRWAWQVVGGAAGGLAVGALVKLIGLDAFDLLFGQAPAGMTGAGEGALIGGAVALGFTLAARTPGSLERRAALAGLVGAGAGVLAVLLGGRLMAGSLDLLARQFPASRLRLDGIGALIGEQGLGPVSQIVTGGLEGFLFAAGVAGAMLRAARSLAREHGA